MERFRRTPFFFFCLMVLLTLLSACEPGDKADAVGEAETVATDAAGWEAHLETWPRHWVPATEPLTVRFRHPVVNADQLNKPLRSLVELQPAVAVTAVFVADNELRITPKDRFPADTPVAVRLLPKDLLQVEQNLPPFVFEVQSIQQDFDLRVDALSVQPDRANAMVLNGEVSLMDVADIAVVRQVLQVKVNGELTTPVWTRGDSDRHYRFTLPDIVRGEGAGKLVLEWDGKALGTDAKGQRELTIPAQSAFEITGVRVVRSPETYVEVNFSAPLNARQNRSGLVSLDRKELPARVDGSALRIYPPELSSEPVELFVASGIQASNGKSLANDYRQSLVLDVVKPMVKFIGRSASILPPAKQLSVPFEAAGVDSVQITAFRIFDNNVGQYLQRNRLHANYADTTSGRYLWRKTWPLPEVPGGSKQRYHLDLTELMAEYPDGLVRLELSIDRSNSTFECDGDRPREPVRELAANYEGGDYYETNNYPAWYNQYYQSSGYYNYSERNNPCHDAYYFYGESAQDSRTFLVSDIGLLAKRGVDDQLLVVTTGLTDGKPLSGADIEVFNFQQQRIGEGKTDQHGMVDITTDGTPFMVQAKHGKSRSYLRVPRNEALPVNQFDVSGEHTQGGLKGFIYGERDVWRPGDDIHLTFILQDREQRVPDNHPVTLDLFDPRGTKVASRTSVQATGDFHTFTLATAEDAPTGNWRAVVHVGSRYFDKILKVETITPNRLKVEITPQTTPLQTDQAVSIDLEAQWLHGASAAGLKADAELKLFTRPTKFAGFDQFVFDDPARIFMGTTEKVFEGILNNQGEAQFAVQPTLENPPPGALTALFNVRVFEESGNFSTIMRAFELQPYDHWAGVYIAAGEGYLNAIDRDSDHPVTLLALDRDGKPAANRDLEINVYSIGWRWWWDDSGEDLASYVGGQHHTPVAKATVKSGNDGRATWTLTKDTYDWGRHLVRVCDTASNHCSGTVVYLGWSSAANTNPESATQLMLTTDRENYNVGDVARVQLPETAQGRILLSLENGSGIIERRWLDLGKNQRVVELPVTAAMAPNVYVHMTLLLPHQQRETDAPMRLYGIVPLVVEDPATRLQPQLTLPQEVRPETAFTIQVKEEQQRPMTYSLAIVDEGLLGITGFKVPDAHAHFYRREALGVNTWDLFDQVVGAYGAALERVLAIGGSDADQEAERQRRERRFPPIVQFVGVFQLAAGETASHDITLPPYMGAVRVMVVAGDHGKTQAYGKVEQTVTVTQPLVLLATLPRVVGPGEEVMLPVNVFVTDAALGEVDITVETNEIFTVLDPQTRLVFDKPGDAIAGVRLKVNDSIGKGRVKITARRGNESASQEIFIDSRAANAPSVVWRSHTIPAGESWTSDLQAHGLAGTNEASLEVSTLPPMNLERRLDYLLNYPHGCLEQVTSSVFPQLYLDKLIDLNPDQKAEISQHIDVAVRRLRTLQQANGSFSYWPGNGYVNDWASSYAGHFLVEAKRAGYGVPPQLLENWTRYQRELARSNNTHRAGYERDVAAYRLYTLALADSAELPAMNRLRENLLADNTLSPRANWLLALAYQHIGLPDVASELLNTTAGRRAPDGSTAQEPDYTYGSALRDRSLLLLANLASNDEDRIWQLAEQVASELGSDRWLSTQSTAWSLIAMSRFAESRDVKQGMNFALRQAGSDQWQEQQSARHVFRQALDNTGVTIRNDSQGPLRVLVSNRGTPPPMQEDELQQGLSMRVHFMTLDNKPLDVQKLAQGTDFVAEVDITGDFDSLGVSRLEDIALTMIMPGGWQIRNERMEDDRLPAGFDYVDIRDDRVLGYFSLWQNHSWSWRYKDRTQNTVTLRVVLNASFAGKYYLPGWQVSAMYDERIQARGKGYWVEVTTDSN